MLKKIIFVSLLSLVLTPLSLAQQPIDWELSDGQSMTIPTDDQAGYSLVVNKGPGTILLIKFHYEQDRKGNKIKVIDYVKVLKEGEFHAEQLKDGEGIELQDWAGDGQGSQGHYIFVS